MKFTDLQELTVEVLEERRALYWQGVCAAAAFGPPWISAAGWCILCKALSSDLGTHVCAGEIRTAEIKVNFAL